MIYNFVAKLLIYWASTVWAVQPDWPGPRRDVRAFGAKGDGATDDTRAIQTAIDSLPRSGGTVVLPPGNYRARNLLISDREGVRLLGVGATIHLFGKSPAPRYVGIQFHGTLRRVTIEGLTILGDGRVDSRHAGLWMTTASHDMVDIIVRGCRVRDVVNGIRFDNTEGRLTRILVERNRVERCVGIEPGEGYGIVHSNGGRTPGAAIILGNTVVGAQRHSIYQSAGSGAMILGNHVVDHRSGVADGRLRAAIAVARSRDIFVAGNRLHRCADAALSVEPSESGAASSSGRVWVTGNVFLDNPGRDAWIGAEIVGPKTGRLEKVAIEHNVFARPKDPINRTESIRIADGNLVTISDNYFDSNRGFRVPYAAVVATGRDGSRLDGLAIERNIAHLSAGEGGSVSLVELGAEIASGDRKVTIRGLVSSTQTQPRLVTSDGPRTNPNLLVEDPTTVPGRPGAPRQDRPRQPVPSLKRAERPAITAIPEDRLFRLSIGASPVEVAILKARSGSPWFLVRFGGSICLVGMVAGNLVPPVGTTRVEDSRPRSFVIFVSEGQAPWSSH